MTRRLPFIVMLGLVVGLAGCTNEEDGSDGGVCSTLKIAGGEGCSNPPKAIVAVRSARAYCSGTFITPRHVLTAAHCFPQGTAGVTIQSDFFSYSATKVEKHPDYLGFYVSDPSDVAIVTIGQDAPITPVPINTSRRLAAGDQVVTYGFGLDEDGGTYLDRIDNGDAALRVTTLDVLSANAAAVRTLSNGFGDTCQGDSGGSLLLDGNDGAPGVVAIVRAGPPACVPEGGASENSNVQTSQNLNFIRQAAPGVRLN